MKNRFFAICSVLFLLNSCVSAQKNENEINQKLDSASDKEIVLVKIVNDSRCPEGVQCVWAGEVTIEVAAYDNRKLIEEIQFTINQSTHQEVMAWFKKHLPVSKQNLKGISVLPHPKEGVSHKKEDYIIKLIY
jgi:hypothetical protein